MKKFFLIILVPLSLTYAEVGFVQPWGRDAEMMPSISFNPPTPENSDLVTKISQIIIQFHQNVISPIDGPRSHFYPISSRYMLTAMKRYGWIKGYIMGCDRLLRENKEEWVYRKIVINGETHKWDPTVSSFKRSRIFTPTSLREAPRR